jgi:hypothetical protein
MGLLRKSKKRMVGTRRLELLTSTVSKFPVAVLTTTYRLLETAERLGNTRKSEFLQVILQASPELRLGRILEPAERCNAFH